MTTIDGTISLVGRRPEQARLAEFLATARSERGCALVVRGAAGIGKTALLDHTARTALDHRVVRVTAVAQETDVPCSALCLLCSALADQLPRLQPHHRHALETAIGLRPGPQPDRMLAGVATLALLTLAAQTRPLLCVVDDAQELDEVSAFVMTFLAHRLGAAPVALLFADRGNGLPGLPELPLGALAPADARLLLDRVLDAPIDHEVAERIVIEARGNPRAVVESVRGTSAAELAGGYRVVAANGAGHELPAGLDRDAALLLLLAAAEPLGDPARLRRAADQLDIAPPAQQQLESAQLVSFGNRVVFAGPRLRSSVYGQASAADRRRVHGALAAATDPATEPDRRAWHLAHSLLGPDDAVADELERTAGIASDRGGLAAAAALLERAAVCSADPGRRVRRAIMAADHHHTAGAGESVTRLLATAALGDADARCRARLTRLRARIAFDHTRSHAAAAQLLASADDLRTCDPSSAQGAYFEAVGAAVLIGDHEVTQAALAQRCTDGYAAGVEPLKLTLKTLDTDHEDDPRARLVACLVAPELWDDDTWHDLTRTELARAQSAGARTLLPYVLTHRALFEVHTGQFAVAQSLVEEASAIAHATGTPPLPHAAAVLAAWRGRPHPALDPANGDSNGMAVVFARYAKAVLCNGLGAYPDAVTAARQAVEGEGPALQGWSLAELVEAAVRSGELDTAAAALDRLSERAVLSGTEWALGLAARSRALLAGESQAEQHYVEAIDRLGRCRVTVHLGRARLVYGEWLRRQGRRADARVPLQAAHQSFTEMGAEAFATRAMRELLATGERARRRVEETRNQLTPQETQIAALAREGRSNPEIATLLSISPRTVEYHLHKVFTKLRIASRTELHLVLGAARDPAEPARSHRVS
ncbi:MAG TPA: AAA family ATPase [Pseudonocardiaceae bacterium]|nr:AAA family ATPase [Pseudonocardiaceae bacterium]